MNTYLIQFSQFTPTTYITKHKLYLIHYLFTVPPYLPVESAVQQININFRTLTL